MKFLDHDLKSVVLSEVRKSAYYIHLSDIKSDFFADMIILNKQFVSFTKFIRSLF